jgi:Protein of unknown function (DUF3102)
MTTQDVARAFDYGQLDGEIWKFVQDATDVIHQIRGQASVQVGEQLAAVKERLNHGQFGDWLSKEFQWSQRYAERLISVWRVFGKSDNFVEISRQLDRSAGYLLAAPSTPQAARDEAIEQAKRGERVTHAKAKAIVAEHKRRSRRAALQADEQILDNELRERAGAVLGRMGITVTAFSETLCPCYSLAPWAFEKFLGEDAIGDHRRSRIALALDHLEEFGSLEAVVEHHQERKDRHAVEILKMHWNDASERARRMFIEWTGHASTPPELRQSKGPPELTLASMALPEQHGCRGPRAAPGSCA